MTTWSPCCTYGLFIDLYIAVNYACNIMYQYWVIVPNLYLISCVHLIILASFIVQFTWTHFPEHVIYFSLSVNHLKPLLVHWLFLKSRVLKTIAFKDDFYYLSFSIFFFYIYKYCSKFNTEFNKLIQTVDHHTRFFRQMLNTPTFANYMYFDSIWIVSYSHLPPSGRTGAPDRDSEN